MDTAGHRDWSRPPPIRQFRNIFRPTPLSHIVARGVGCLWRVGDLSLRPVIIEEHVDITMFWPEQLTPPTPLRAWAPQNTKVPTPSQELGGTRGPLCPYRSTEGVTSRLSLKPTANHPTSTEPLWPRACRFWKLVHVIMSAPTLSTSLLIKGAHPYYQQSNGTCRNTSQT